MGSFNKIYWILAITSLLIIVVSEFLYKEKLWLETQAFIIKI